MQSAHADDEVHCLVSTMLTTNKVLDHRAFESSLVFVLSSFLVIVLMVATAPSETPAAALGRLFKGPTATLGTSWVNSVDSGWSEASLHRQVVATGTVKAAKTRDVYGHFRTATQMQRSEGTYWRKDRTLRAR